MTLKRQIVIAKLAVFCHGLCRMATKTEVRNGRKAAKRVIATKRGFPIYDRNPSVPAPNGIPTRMKPVKIANGNRAMIIGKDTGELLGDAHAASFEMRAVDQGQFVRTLSGRNQEHGEAHQSGNAGI